MRAGGAGPLAAPAPAPAPAPYEAAQRRLLSAQAGDWSFLQFEAEAAAASSQEASGGSFSIAEAEQAPAAPAAPAPQAAAGVSAMGIVAGHVVQGAAVDASNAVALQASRGGRRRQRGSGRGGRVGRRALRCACPPCRIRASWVLPRLPARLSGSPTGCRRRNRPERLPARPLHQGGQAVQVRGPVSPAPRCVRQPRWRACPPPRSLDAAACPPFEDDPIQLATACVASLLTTTPHTATRRWPPSWLPWACAWRPTPWPSPSRCAVEAPIPAQFGAGQLSAVRACRLHPRPWSPRLASRPQPATVPLAPSTRPPARPPTPSRVAGRQGGAGAQPAAAAQPARHWAGAHRVEPGRPGGIPATWHRQHRHQLGGPAAGRRHRH